MNSRIASIALLLATLFASAAARADTFNEFARVNQKLLAGNSLVTGANPVALSAKASEVYWFNSSTNAYTSALGASGNTAATFNGGALRAYAANSAATGPFERSLAKLTMGSSNYATEAWSIDLGANMLSADTAGYKVSGSGFYIGDFGNAGSQTVWFDFKIGLWDGTKLSFANSLSQLTFGVTSARGGVSYQGNNTFRFTETGTGSGTDLNIVSALSGQYVRTFATTAFGRSGTSAFSSDYVDLFAYRSLTSTTPVPVPEPASAGLLGLGLLTVFVARRRSR